MHLLGNNANSGVSSATDAATAGFVLTTMWYVGIKLPINIFNAQRPALMQFNECAEPHTWASGPTESAHCGQCDEAPTVALEHNAAAVPYAAYAQHKQFAQNWPGACRS